LFIRGYRGRTKEEALVDLDMAVRYGHNPAETINFRKENNEKTSTIQIFTDGSKSDQGVVAGIAIYRSGIHIKSLKYRLNKRCTNNQAEQLATFKAQVYTENIHTEDKTATIYTDSQVTLVSLKYSNIHAFLVEEIRRKLTEMEKTNWKIQFCWVKAHFGI
jgi:ribonuclease HI